MPTSTIVKEYVYELRARIQRASVHWDRGSVIPQCLAMDAAFATYQKTLKEQADADQARFDRVMLIASTIAIGPISALLSNAGKGAIKEFAIRSVCDRNMVRTFNVLHVLERSPVASFLLGKGYDTVMKFTEKATDGAAIRSALNVTIPPVSSVSGAPIPRMFEAQLKSTLQTTHVTLLDVLAATMQSNFNDDMKMEMAKEVTRSPFFEVFEVKSLPAFQDAMELSLYLTDVLDTDYLETTKTVVANRAAANIVTRSRIPGSPSASNYPQGTFHRTSPVSYERTQVRYEKIGDVISERVDTLHKNLFSTPFFNGNEKGWLSNAVYPSQDTLRRAEATLLNLSSKKNSGFFESRRVIA